MSYCLQVSIYQMFHTEAGNETLEEEASEGVEAPFLKMLSMKGPQQPELI